VLEPGGQVCAGRGAWVRAHRLRARRRPRRDARVPQGVAGEDELPRAREQEQAEREQRDELGRGLPEVAGARTAAEPETRAASAEAKTAAEPETRAARAEAKTAAEPETRASRAETKTAAEPKTRAVRAGPMPRGPRSAAVGRLGRGAHQASIDPSPATGLRAFVTKVRQYDE